MKRFALLMLLLAAPALAAEVQVTSNPPLPLPNLIVNGGIEQAAPDGAACWSFGTANPENFAIDRVADGRSGPGALHLIAHAGVMSGYFNQVVKVKPEKTADCLVVGLRWKSKPDRIATLLLGLYDEDREIDYVGSAAVAPTRHAEIAARVLPLLEDASDRRFSEPNRWGTGELEEAAVRPELVVEVRYDKVQSNRFRHGTKLIRFRDDKDPAQCTWRELRPARPAGLTLASLLD
jgi:hypothetical protein